MMADNETSLSVETIAQLEQLAPMAAKAKCIAVMTGAGVSAESGVPTFREAQTGLWAKHDPVMLASVEGFTSDPAQVWRWYDERRQTMQAVSPNPGHYAFAEWEQHWREQGREFQLITQNIDNLHGRAGSTDIIEMHGNIWCVRAVDAPLSEATLLDECPLRDIPPYDAQGRMLRPHVVWFGEQLNPLDIEASFDWASRCDLMIVAGTSSVVYPAAAVPYDAKRKGAVVVEINPEPTELTRYCDYALQAPSGLVMPALWQRVQELQS